MTLGTFNTIPKPWETLTEARIRTRDMIHRDGDKLRSKQHTLSHTGGNDYQLPVEHNSVWVQVDDTHIYIRRTENSVVAEIMQDDDDGELISLDQAVRYIDG